MTYPEAIAHYLGKDKRGQSVQEHLREVADFASSFASKIGLSSLGELEGLLHDLGKYSNDFQVYIRSAEGMLDPDTEPVNAAKLKGKIDHSTAGAQVVWEAFKDRNPMSMLVAQAVSICVSSHHSRGGLNDCLSPNGEDKFSIRMAKGVEATHLNEVQKMADKTIQNKITDLIHSSECAEELKEPLKQLLVGEKSKLVREFYVGFLVRFLFSALIDADRLSSAGSGRANSPSWEMLIERLERHISGIVQKNWVDKIRSEVSLACRDFSSRDKGLYQLTVPTGGAKTLSSLRFGLHHAARHKMDRIIYVIPYTSIIDQNAAVARVMLEEDIDGRLEPIVLEHHSNLTPEEETWQSSLLSENWDASVIFTTTVQFLETLFVGGTRGVRRMHQLANAVIIFDEIQTLPIKTVHLFNNAINFLVKQCGSTVVFCTATQPLLHAVDSSKGAARLTDRPEMAPRPNELFKELRRVEVLDKRKIGGWKEDEIAQLICDEARESGSALAIVNTKAAAQALYDLCKLQINNVYHLSTNMCPAHRLKIIENIKKRLDPENPVPKPLVCVSTQLIEAGVDFDFGSVIRYMAGLDSIAQAAGRCNRNGRRVSGEVLIVNPVKESLEMLPEIETGKHITERVLDEYLKNPIYFDQNIISPMVLQRYYEYYFFERAYEMSYLISSKDIDHDDDLLSLLSTNYLSVAAYTRQNKISPSLPLKQSFKSAGSIFRVIDAPTDGIIVYYGEEGKRIINELCASDNVEKTRQLLRKAQHYSVNVYHHIMKKLNEMGCLHETQKGSGIFYLDERYYSADMGLVFDRKESMDFLNI